MDAETQAFLKAQEEQISALTQRVAALEAKIERLEGRLDEHLPDGGERRD
jgi:uncharacterized protein involved in exopolysaccharide biosynthesis